MTPRTLTLLALAALLAATGCSTTRSERRYSKSQAAQSLARLETVGLEIGEFSIDGEDSVVDGDTLRVKGLKSSLRLIGIDTEEIVHKTEERRAMAEGWEKYLKKMRGNSDRPVKMATPLGYDAMAWAQAFFKGVSKVKLERDHPGEIRDYYGRYLAYVLIQKDGKWINYNIECVRAGMAPYFTKYAFSRRFHKEFVEAQAQAQAAKLGIWDPARQHYPDYDERLTWWNARAEVIDSFEKEAELHDNYQPLTRWDALKRLEKRVGQEVVVLGSVSEIRLGDSGPTLVKLARTRTSDFDVVFFDKDVFLSSGVQKCKGEYVRIKGVLRRYHDANRNQDKLQIVVTSPNQVILPDDSIDEPVGTGRRVDAVPAEKGAIKPTPKVVATVPKADPKPTVKPADKIPELPVVANRPADEAPKTQKTGPLDLVDASKDKDLDFSKGDKASGPLDLGDTSGDLDFSSLGDAPEY